MFGSGKRGLLLAFLFIFSVSNLYSSPVISEVMSNVKGSDTGAGSPGDRNEYVELYNGSDSNIVITHYFIGDGDAVDNIDVWNDSLGQPANNVLITDSILHPHQFAVILDPEYCEKEYANQSYFMPYGFGDSCLILTVGNTTIGDGLSTSDPIFLYDSNLVIVDTYGTPFDTLDNIPRDPGDGISMEKIYLNGTDGENNWQPSKSPLGCTPGKYNSVSENNLIKVDFSYQTLADTFVLKFDLINNFHIDLQNTDVWLNLLEFSGVGDMENIDSVILFSGNIEDSVFNLEYRKPLNEPAVHMAQLIIKNTQISSIHDFWINNNMNSIPPLEINEILEHNGILPDWIEIHNISDDTIKLNDSHIDIGTRTYELPDFSVNPGEYKVILHDTASFFLRYSRNIDLLISRSNLTISSGDTLRFRLRNCTMDELYINRDLHFGQDTSIERIKSSVPASNEDNWTFSRNEKGATPGEKNSVSDTSLIEEQDTMSVSPNPFDYKRDNAISFKFPANSYMIKFIHIYKTDGYKLADLKINNPYLKEILWKPKSNNGNDFSTGLYIAVFKYEDNNGKEHLIKTPLAVKNR
ncbi:MAG: hypothetical protein GWP03_05940 [Proteobacteria bacterium]|nr:hypothetical protein [Pseudomonadota bacterium]